MDISVIGERSKTSFWWDIYIHIHINYIKISLFAIKKRRVLEILGMIELTDCKARERP